MSQEQLKLDLKPEDTKVFIATVNNSGFTHEYVKNSFASFCWLLGYMGVAAVSMTFDEHPISVARNAAVEHFLKAKRYTHLFFVDADVVVPPDSIINLLNDKHDVVNGWYLSRKGTGYPVIMKREGKFNGWCNIDNFNTYKSYSPSEFLDLVPTADNPNLIKVPAVGAGCQLVKREVYEKLGDKPYYESHNKFHDFGEDLYFCENCYKNNINIWIDKRVFCGHIGWKMLYREELNTMLDWELGRREKQADSAKTENAGK